MQTIIVKLCPGKLQNPDLDIRYRLPDAVEGYTEGRITDNGYDYLDQKPANDIAPANGVAPANGIALGIWLACENAAEGVNDLLTVMRRETICGNDLSQSAEIYISEKDTDDIENCQKVYPFDSEDSVS